MLSRSIVLCAVVAIARLVCGQDEGKGWVRTLWQDGKSYVWTLEDSGGRGAHFTYRCDGQVLTIQTREFLLDMADPDDGKIRVACLAPDGKRLSVDSLLAGDQHGVTFEDDEADALERWLRFEYEDQPITLILSNSGKRETYTFQNYNATPGVDGALNCDKPKKPKKK